jgi:hypothetical protein
VHDIVVTGPLTAAAFRTRLDDVAGRFRQDGDHALLVDVLAMTSYEPVVRDDYIAWHRRHGAQLRRIAVVTNRAMWRLIVATIGLATGGTTRAFESRDEAARWLRDG